MRTRHRTRLAPIVAAIAAALLLPAALLTAALLPASAALAGEEGGPAVALPAPGTGTLYWRSPQGPVPLPALTIEADLRVTGILVQGTVRQTIRNKGAHPVHRELWDRAGLADECRRGSPCRPAAAGAGSPEG